MNVLDLGRKVDMVLFRNYGVFFLTLILCMSVLIFLLVSGEKTLSQIDEQVTHTHSVISNAQELAKQVEGMLAAQRGYIITKDEKFLDKYHSRRNQISGRIANLTELTTNNQSQLSRLDELRHHFNEFSIKLEQRAQTFTITSSTRVIIENIEEVDGLKDNIQRIINDILNEEYNILNESVNNVEIQKSRYFKTLLIGILSTSILLLLFNGYLFNIQRKRHSIEESLRDTEERFALAIEGTQDGIFDWNIRTGDVFFSSKLFDMLGYDRGPFIGTIEDLYELIHADERAGVEDYTERYFNHEYSDYAQEFRLKHKDGQWVWIQSRAKAIFDHHGKALRLVGAHTDITYLKAHQERLEQEKKAAEDANKAKSDFLAHMSHEIRTPLTAISGIAEIFLRKFESFDEKQQRLVKTLFSSTSVLKDLINDILDFSKIDSGELELEEDNFEVGNLFEEVISMMSVRANEKDISFIFDYENVKNLEIYSDKLRLRQIVVNLVGNAVKFTEEGGVTVKAYTKIRNKKNCLMIEVTDTGSGIAPENFDLIFERFKQADASVSRRYGGTGLGLPISRNLAQLMNGDIILKSEVNKGSTFTLYIPLKNEAKAQPKKAASGNEKSKKKSQKVIVDANEKILMVEDYAGNIVVLSHILDDMECHYDIANTGVEAVDLWQKNKYALILMDVQMPEMDGMAATRKIRDIEEKENLEQTPIIGMTAHALVGDKDKCIAAGMNSYLPKPIVEADLKKQILKYLKNAKKAA